MNERIKIMGSRTRNVPSPGDGAWYALRRTLPPWRFRENLRELETALPKYRVDELIVKIDTEEFTHGQPPLDWVVKYQRNLEQIRDTLRPLGIRYSLNPWITVGHNDRGRDAREQVPGIQTMVGHDGTRCTCSACPLSPAWRTHVTKVWTVYAQTRPHVIWIEDDIRTFNHLPVRFGCFCPLHLGRFSARIGRKVGREELVAAILRPGKPDPWRTEYLDMQAEIMTETVGFLAGVVHKASPETRLGLMSSGARNHAMEGRDWNAFCQALSDGSALYSRAPMGNYHENSLRGFYASHDAIKLTRHCMPAGTLEQTEVENVPFTRYSKSAVFTFLETALSFAYGSHGVTLNLFDHCGTPMEEEPVFGKLLAETRPFLDALAKRARGPGSFRGVRLLFDPRESHSRHLEPGADYPGLVADGAAVMQALESHGIPTTYDPSNVCALTGQTARALTDAQIEELLGDALLLDGMAAHILVERGFGKRIGLTRADYPVPIDSLGALSAEEHHHRSFGGKARKYLTLTVPNLGKGGRVSGLEFGPGTELVSSLVDPDTRRRFPGMTAFENPRGGRIIAHALELSTGYGIAFNHPFRAQQLQNAVRWLSRNRPPLLVRGGGVYPLAFCREREEGLLLGLFNLSLDPWDGAEFEMTCSWTPSRVERLLPDGRWRKEPRAVCRRRGKRLFVRYSRPVPFQTPLFLALHRDT